MFKKVKVFQAKVVDAIRENHFEDLFEDSQFCSEWDEYWEHFQAHDSDKIGSLNLEFFSGFLVGQYLRGLRQPEGAYVIDGEVVEPRLAPYLD